MLTLMVRQYLHITKYVTILTLFMNGLEDNTIYKCMVVGVCSEGIKTSATSIYLSKETNREFLADQIVTYCTGIQMKYMTDFTR